MLIERHHRSKALVTAPKPAALGNALRELQPHQFWLILSVVIVWLVPVKPDVN